MTHFRKRSKAIFAFVCVLTLMLQMLAVMPVSAANEELDVIFVLDDSGSMEDNDPNKLSVTAISKFVDTVTTQDAQYGVAIYGDEVRSKLELGATKDEVKEFVRNNAHQNEIHTNAAAGIKWATEELKNSKRNNAKKAIILIGDGVNDQDDYRTKEETRVAEEKSEEDRLAAIQTAKDNSIAVYAIAVNESGDPNFKEYFQNIADETNGICYEPKNFGELENDIRSLLGTLVGAMSSGKTTTTLPGGGTPEVSTITVDNGVYQLIVRCDYQDPLEIWLTSQSGMQYDKNTVAANCVYIDDTVNKYIQYTITEPEVGEWTITYKSETPQTVATELIRYNDVMVTLKPTPGEVIEGNTARFVADVMSNNQAVTDEATLKGFEPKIAVVKVDKNGNRGKVEYSTMDVVSGQLSAEPKFKSAGDYVLFVELKGDTNTIVSNELTITVNPDPNKLPLWVIILIILGVVLLIVAAILGFMAMRNSPDYINSELGVKITAKTPSQETMIFQNNVFNCSATFGKQNTFSDVIRAYVNWYRSIGSGELTEMTINQYLNASLAEVTDKIKFSGTKSGKTVIVVPKGLDIEVDGNPVKNEKKIEFAGSEKEIEFVINNNGYNYIIELVFRK